MRFLRATSRAPGARVVHAAVALALFGLLSMHGWGAHVGGHAVAMAPAGVMAAPQGDGHDAPAPAALAPAMSGTDGVPQAPHDDVGGSLLELCLAVLCGVLLGLALLLGGRRLPVPRWFRPPWIHPAPHDRDRDPPDLVRLCVIRC